MDWTILGGIFALNEFQGPTLKYGSFLHFSVVGVGVVWTRGKQISTKALKCLDWNQLSVERLRERGVKKSTIWQILKIVFLSSLCLLLSQVLNSETRMIKGPYRACSWSQIVNESVQSLLKTWSVRSILVAQAVRRRLGSHQMAVTGTRAGGSPAEGQTQKNSDKRTD